MAIWLIRAGLHGEYEQKFLEEKRVYVTWPRLSVNLDVLPDRDGLYQAMSQTYPGASQAKRMSDVSQVWPFAHDMKKGDLVLMPLRSKPAITIGEVTGPYRFEHAAQGPLLSLAICFVDCRGCSALVFRPGSACGVCLIPYYLPRASQQCRGAACRHEGN